MSDIIKNNKHESINIGAREEALLSSSRYGLVHTPRAARRRPVWVFFAVSLILNCVRIRVLGWHLSSVEALGLAFVCSLGALAVLLAILFSSRRGRRPGASLRAALVDLESVLTHMAGTTR